MLTQPVIFEHVQQSGFPCVIQPQEHQFSRLLVQTCEEKEQSKRKTPVGSSGAGTLFFGEALSQSSAATCAHFQHGHGAAGKTHTGSFQGMFTAMDIS